MDTTLLVATWLFAVTHVDTLAVLVAFCTDEDYRPLEVLSGHYLGFTVGLVVAVVGAAVAAELLRDAVFLLGVVPVALGVYGVSRARQPSETAAEPVIGSTGRIGVVAATGIGLSGENVAIFIPFFARLSTLELGTVLVWYLAAAGALFLVAFGLARRTAARTPAWVNRWLVPIVLIIVGLYVLASGWLVA